MALRTFLAMDFPFLTDSLDRSSLAKYVNFDEDLSKLDTHFKALLIYNCQEIAHLVVHAFT